MPTPFTGGCACGAIRYECSAEPLLSANCHCRNCQRASGSAYASPLFVPTPAFRFLKGEPKYYTAKADNGHTTHRGFCVDCGSPVVGKVDERPAVVLIWAASLDDPSWHRPRADFFTASAQPWDYLNPALRKFERGGTEDQLQELLTAR
jgi:hypothetical protein